MLAVELQDTTGAEEYCASPDSYGLVSAGPDHAERVEDLRRDLLLRLLKVYLADNGYVMTNPPPRACRVQRAQGG